MAQTPNQPDMLDEGQPAQPGTQAGTQAGQQNIAGQPAPNRVGTGFTNIQNVLNANKNNQLGNTIQSGINTNVQNVQNSAMNEYGQFENQKNQNSLNNSQNNTEVQNTLNSIDTDPSKISNQQYQDFGNFTKGSYQGPNSLQDADQLTNQATNTEQLGNMIGSSGGRQALLQRFVGGNRYTSGQQNLDNLLLGQTGGDQLKQARQSTIGLTQNVNNVNNTANQEALAAIQQNKDFASNVNNLLSGKTSGINSDIDSAYKNAGAADQTTQANYQKILDMLKSPAAQSNSGPNTENVDPSMLALQQLSDQGLISKDQFDQMSQQIGTGFYDPNDAINKANAAAQTQRSQQLQADQAALSQYNQQLQAMGNNSDSAAPRLLDANGQPLVDADGNPLNADALQQQISQLQNTPMETKHMTKLSDIGIDPSQLIMKNLATSGATNYSRNAFIDPQKAAQLNALAKLSGQGNQIDPSTLPQYQGASNKYDSGSALGQINKAEQAYLNSQDAQTYQKSLQDQGLGQFLTGVNPADFAALGPMGATPAAGLAGYDIANHITGGHLANTVTDVGHGLESFGNNVTGAVGQAGNAINRIAGRYFCTELYNRGMATWNEVVEMSKFFFGAMFTTSRIALFYAKNGKIIASVANKHGFDWSTMKDKLITNIISLRKQGKYQDAREAYSLVIKDMCLKFPETQHLWNDRHLQTTTVDKIKCIPQLVFTKTFYNAGKIFIREKIGFFQARTKGLVRNN